MMKDWLTITLAVIITGAVVAVSFIFDLSRWLLYFVFGGLVVAIYWLAEGRKKKQ